MAQSESYLKDQATRRKTSGASDAAMIDFCHVLLNANELIYVD
jgi:hypothetical protein